jgi:hypothetical protein
MNPSINHRLDSMIRAMTEIILPALGSSNGLATEQAGLLLGHLNVLKLQLEYASRYQQAELYDAMGLARALIAEASGGAETKAAIARLSATFEEPRGNYTVRADDKLESINEAIENIIHAMKSDGEPVSRTLTHRLILNHGKATAERDRVWFSAMGFEAAESGLPSFSDMLASLPEIVAVA